jgi:hypothetical protein
MSSEAAIRSSKSLPLTLEAYGIPWDAKLADLRKKPVNIEKWGFPRLHQTHFADAVERPTLTAEKRAGVARSPEASI